MTAPAAALSTILLVDDDPASLEAFERALAHQPAMRVATAADGVQGLAVARRIRPDVIISDYQMPAMNGFELCRQVRADPELADCIFVVLSGFSDTQLKVQGLDLGVDEYLTKPIELPELLARVRSSLRLKQLQDQLRHERDALAGLHQQLGRSFDQLLELLLHLVDLGLPGAAERGKRLTELARRVAERFEVPAEMVHDLELAAQLHEVGKVVDAAHQHGGAPAYPAWHYAVVSAALLEAVERLRGAAEIIGGVYENWDGTGQPSHFVSGQIPLRARILRVAIDFYQALDSGDGPLRRNPAEVLDALSAHEGTWYDPLALRHLESVVLDRPREEWHATRAQVAVDRLQVGMVLARDLCTSSGVKLLAGGTTISDSMLAVIQRRHLADPIVDGVWISLR